MDSAQAISNVPQTQASHLFGELLVSKGLLSREELVKVLNEQREQGGRLGEVLLQLKMLNDADVTEALAEHFSIEYVRFDDINKADKINMDVARMLPEAIAKRFCLVAIGELGDEVVVVMADPLNVVAIDTVALKIKRKIRPAISSPREIRRAIELIYHGSDVEEQQLRDLVELEVGTEKKEEDILVEDVNFCVGIHFTYLHRVFQTHATAYSAAVTQVFLVPAPGTLNKCNAFRDIFIRRTSHTAI